MKMENTSFWSRLAGLFGKGKRSRIPYGGESEAEEDTGDFLVNLERRCGTIRTKLEGVLFWKWDPRFNMVLAEFRDKYSIKVYAVISDEFNSRWDENNLSSAPAPVKKTARALGGVRGKQFLFTRNVGQGVLLTGAWWPWNSGQRISLRIGVSDISSRNVESESFLKKCFGIK